MIFHCLNPQIQFGKVNFDLTIIDPSGIIPFDRVSIKLPLNPLPRKADLVPIITARLRALAIGASQNIIDQIQSEANKPLASHTLIIDRPDNNSNLGA